jgi:hypothetical protein
VPEADDSQGWRDGLRQWFVLVRAIYRAHPWFPDIPVSTVPMTPNNLMMADEALRAMRDLPLSQSEKLATLLLISTYSRAVGTLERDLMVPLNGAGDPSGSQYGEALAQVVTEERFPYLYPLIASGVYTGGGESEPLDQFQFGLERILDGVEQHVAHADRPTPAVELPEPPYPTDSRVKAAARARREAEAKLREARKLEREAIKRAREDEKRAREDAQRAAEKAARK